MVSVQLQDNLLSDMDKDLHDTIYELQEAIESSLDEMSKLDVDVGNYLNELISQKNMRKSLDDNLKKPLKYKINHNNNIWSYIIGNDNSDVLYNILYSKIITILFGILLITYYIMFIMFTLNEFNNTKTYIFIGILTLNFAFNVSYGFTINLEITGYIIKTFKFWFKLLCLLMGIISIIIWFIKNKSTNNINTYIFISCNIINILNMIIIYLFDAFNWSSFFKFITIIACLLSFCCISVYFIYIDDTAIINIGYNKSLDVILFITSSFFAVSLFFINQAWNVLYYNNQGIFISPKIQIVWT